MNLILTITFLFLLYPTLSQLTPSFPTVNINDDLISSGYTQVSIIAAQNDANIQDLLNFGMQYLTEQEIIAERLPYAEYQISQILGVYNQVSTGTRYCFDVYITNDQGWTLRATYVIYSEPATGIKNVESYVYDVTVNPVTGEEQIPDESSIAEGSYLIDKAEVETNQEIQEALNYGINQTINQSIENHQLPVSEYNLIEVYSIYGQMATGMNYRFDIELRNCAGLTVRVIFIVISGSWPETFGLTPIYLNITRTPTQGLIGGYCAVNRWGSSEEEVLFDGVWKESDGFTLVELDQAAIDPDVQNALGSGLEAAIAQGIQDGELPDEVYQEDGLYSVEKQDIDEVKYRFDVGVIGDGGTFGRVRFVVSYNQESDLYELSSYLVVYVEDPAS